MGGSEAHHRFYEDYSENKQPRFFLVNAKGQRLRVRMNESMTGDRKSERGGEVERRKTRK